MTRRMSWPWPIGVMARMVPSAVMMPVNIRGCSLACKYTCSSHYEPAQSAVHHSILANSLSVSSPTGRMARADETRHQLQTLHAERLDGRPAIRAHHRGRVEPGDAIHQIGSQQRRGDLGAALHQDLGEAGLGQRGKTLGEIDAGARPGGLDHLHAQVGDGTAALRVGACTDQHPGRAFVGSGDKARGQGVRRWVSTITRTTGIGRNPGIRQVSSGSSASTVPTPTSTASCRARIACPRRRAGAPVIQRLSPAPVAIRPSSVAASFSVTRRTVPQHPAGEAGDDVPRLGFEDALGYRDAGGAQPFEPSPFTRGSGSRMATTARATPASISASVQGGVWP